VRIYEKKMECTQKKECGKIFKKKRGKKRKHIHMMGGGNAEFGFGQDEDDEEEDLWANVDARFVWCFFFVRCFFCRSVFL